MIYPPFLQAKDTVRLLAPAGIVTPVSIEHGVQWLIDNDFTPEVGIHLTDNYFRYAAKDEHRLHDLQKALDSPTLKAIWCVRGGYGMIRILDKIDWTGFCKFPKWIIGFSDITALHLKINQLGFASLHAFMPVQFRHLKDDCEKVNCSTQSLKNSLLGNAHQVEALPSVFNKKGSAKGELIGGNLSSLVNSLGTSTEIDTTNKILFLEEVSEALYAIDRMLWQLKRSGKLAHLKALVVGDFSELSQTKAQFGQGIEEIIREITQEYTYPVAFNFPIGHTAHNEAIICGSQVELYVQETTSLIKFVFEKKAACS